MEEIMKLLITILTLGLNFTLLANQITHSTYDLRHQEKITQAISNKCNYFGNFFEESKTINTIKIDQGITDYQFTTVIKIVSTNGSRHAIAHSEYLDQYDTNLKTWGVYYITDIECQ